MIWLNDDFQQMRIRHEWRINGQLSRPWRLYPGAPRCGTLAQMVEHFCYINLPQRALAIMWDGKKWTVRQVPDTSSWDAMSYFLPLEGEKLNPHFSLVFSTPVGTPAAGAFYGILQSEGFQDVDELYLGMRLTAFHRFPGPNKETCEFFFSYNSEFNPRPLRELTHQRLKALEHAIDGYPLSWEEMMRLGQEKPDTSLLRGRQLWVEGRINQGISFMLRAFNTISDSALRAPDGEDLSLYYEIAYSLGEAYYEKGLYAKALYYLELSQGTQQEGDRDVPLVSKCKLRVHDFRVAEALAQQPTVGEWSGLPLNRWTIVLRACLDITADDLLNMLVLVDGNHRNPISVKGAKIMDFPIFRIIRQPEVKMVQAYIALKDGRIAVAELRGSDTIDLSACVTQFFDWEAKPKYVNLIFGRDNWVSHKEFLDERSRLSQMLVDQKPLEPTEMLWLGGCERAHLSMARAIEAIRNNAYGDALYYLQDAYEDVTSKLGTGNLDHFDLQLIGYLCYNLGYVYSVLGLHDQAISYLIKLKDSKNMVDILELGYSLISQKDIRALDFLDHQIMKQKIYQNSETERHNFNSAAFRLMRRQRVKVLRDRNRITQLKKELGSLICDIDEATRNFAYDELARLSQVNSEQ